MALPKAREALAQARRELEAALTGNPDAEAQRLAANAARDRERVEATLRDTPPQGPGLCELINHLNGLAQVVRETVAGLRFVDVRR